ncbi:MAG: hypothetical protein IMZ62_05720 [Chloroflexi bacterium]|nr:hypothetical protein [Chloroflexota bacterium]
MNAWEIARLIVIGLVALGLVIWQGRGFGEDEESRRQKAEGREQRAESRKTPRAGTGTTTEEGKRAGNGPAACSMRP